MSGSSIRQKDTTHIAYGPNICVAKPYYVQTGSLQQVCGNSAVQRSTRNKALLLIHWHRVQSVHSRRISDESNQLQWYLSCRRCCPRGAVATAALPGAFAAPRGGGGGGGAPPPPRSLHYATWTNYSRRTIPYLPATNALACLHYCSHGELQDDRGSMRKVRSEIINDT